MPAHALAQADAAFGVPVTSLFAPSPRVADFGLSPVASLFHYQRPVEGAGRSA